MLAEIPKCRTWKWCARYAESLTSCGRAPAGKYESLIEFVKDRPGHDRRYAIDSRKIQAEIGWRPIRDLRFRDAENSGLVPR